MPATPDDKARGGSGRADVDLEIRVGINHETELTYTLHSPSGNADYHQQSVEGVSLKASPREYWRSLVERIENLAGKRDVDGSGLSGPEAIRHLEGIGHDLFSELFSRSLRHEYALFRKTVRTLLITSEEPWIPWELIKPFDTDLGIDDDFLCIQFQLTRWLSGNQTPPDLIQVVNRACIEAGMVKGRAPLPMARLEKELISNLADASSPDAGMRSPQRGTWPEVIDLLERGGTDLIHFVSHGDFDPAQPDRSEIMLPDGRSFRAHDVQGLIERRLRADRPLVFLNACRVGAQSWSLTGLGGWADRWVRRSGCSAFVGPQWSVTDHNAYAFAMGFYRYLQQGLTIGEAVQQSRLAVRKRSPHDPTWLAYSVYAHPNSRVVFGSEPESKQRQSVVDASHSIERVESEIIRSLAPSVSVFRLDDSQPALPKEPIWKRTAAFASKRPAWTTLGAAVLSVLLIAGLFWLGQQSHREREYLLHIDPLDYPAIQLLGTGAEVLYSLPQKAVAAPFLGNPEIQTSSLVLILTVILWLWMTRAFGPSTDSKSKRLSLPVGIRIALLGLTALALTIGSLFYTLAIQTGGPLSAGTGTLAACPEPGRVDPAGGKPRREGLIEQMTFETCSWLRNDSELNKDRRESLNGLILWLLAALGAAAWAAWRIPAPQGWKRHVQLVLGAVHLMAYLFLATRLPTAHAYGKWGLRYPEVERVTAGCGAGLAEEIGKNCFVYDVTEGATTRKLFFIGNCTQSRGWSPGWPDCLLETGARSVVVKQGAVAPR